MSTSAPQSTIKIAIDGNEANVAHPVGSNVYAQEILKALEKATQVATKDHQQIDCTVLLSGPTSSALPPARDYWRYEQVSPAGFFTQYGLPMYLFRHRREFDVFFTPGHYAPRACPIKYVSSVMDTGYLTFPDHFKKKDLLQLTNWTEYSVKHAQKIVAISQATKKDVVKHYQKDPTDIVVAYPSLPPAASNTKDVLPKSKLNSRFDVSDDYIVYIGTLQPRKNIINLIEAFERVTRTLESQKINQKTKLRSKHRSSKGPVDSLQLVLAGKAGWLADPILTRIARSPFTDRIITPGFVSELEKRSLLKHACCSALVGLHEGFGIPALESMAVRTIPVVSKTSSLPEVVGKAGILVDPTSVISIANGLQKAVLLTTAGQRTYTRHMLSQVRSFSWEKSAAIILEHLVEIAKQKK